MIFIEYFKNYIGNLAVGTTILQFLSGILVCKQYVVNKTTAESSPMPFICGILSGALWFLYGLTKRDEKIILVNTIGVTLMTAYTTVFYIYTFKKSALLKQCMIMFVLLLLLVWYVLTEENTDRLIHSLGVFASLLTLLTVVAPMTKLFYVIKVKNTECLPFPMIVMSFFVSTLWFLYGQIDGDLYISWVNLMGGMLAVAQLSLFVIYPSRPVQYVPKSILA